MDAKLLYQSPSGPEVRLCTRKKQTWPGYHESCPLGRTGYWWGTFNHHKWLGRGEEAKEEAIFLAKFWEE